MLKASVIIPTYKPQDYIYECMHSVLHQSYPPENYEIIVIINGCDQPYRDSLSDFIDSISLPSHNIHLLQTDQGGVSNARNIGLDEAQGEYILFLDDDDYISPTYIESLVSCATPNSIVAAKLSLFDDQTRQEIQTALTKAYDTASEQIKKNPLTLYSGRRLLSAVGGKAIPRKLIGNLRFNPNFALGEDSLFITTLTKRMHSILLAPPHAIYYVRQRNNSASRRPISNYSQISNALRLAWQYTRMYLSDIPHNNLKFYLTRIAASLLKAFSKKYRTV